MKGIASNHLRPREGFTLVEVILAIAILGMASYAFGTMMLSSKLWLNKAYYKGKAMEITSSKMEENLAKSFGTVNSTTGQECLDMRGFFSSATETECLAQRGVPFTWELQVKDLLLKTVPYKRLELRTSYLEGETEQAVFLSGITAYPYIHIVTNDFRQTGLISIQYSPIYSTDLNFPVKKNLIVSYTIAVSVEDAAGIQPLHTIYSRCRITTKTGAIFAYPETRTPILTQPLINNWIQVTDIPAGPATLTIEWKKESSEGDVYGESGNAVVIAVENL